MSDDATRIERDSMGEMQVPVDALYGASTARAIENFPVAQEPIFDAVIHAFGHLKAACAVANRELGKLDEKKASAIIEAAKEVAAGCHLRGPAARRRIAEIGPRRRHREPDRQLDPAGQHPGRVEHRGGNGGVDQGRESIRARRGYPEHEAGDRAPQGLGKPDREWPDVAEAPRPAPLVALLRPDDLARDRHLQSSRPKAFLAGAPWA